MESNNVCSNFIMDHMAGSYVQTFQKTDTRPFCRVMPIEKALNTFNGYTDVFYSINPVFPDSSKDIYCRKQDKMTVAKWLYVDIDCGELNLNPYSVYDEIKNNYICTDIPAPSISMFSGTGLWLLWAVSDVNMLEDKDRWSNMQTYLCRLFKKYGADPKVASDNARIYRILNSKSSKSGNTVSCIECTEKKYDFDEVYSRYYQEIEEISVPEIDEKHQKSKKTRKNIGKKVNTTRPISHRKQLSPTFYCYINNNPLCSKRLRDLDRLVKTRGEGYREVLLFLMRIYLTNAGIDKCIQDRYILDRNKMFDVPLSETEALNATISGKKYATKYMYTNAGLIELLDITEEEQKSLSSIISKSESIRRKKERNAKYYQKKLAESDQKTKSAQIVDVVTQISKLLDEGLTNSEIMSKLSLAKTTYYRYKSMIGSVEMTENVENTEVSASSKNSVDNIINNNKYKYYRYCKHDYNTLKGLSRLLWDMGNSSKSAQSIWSEVAKAVAKVGAENINNIKIIDPEAEYKKLLKRSQRNKLHPKQLRIGITA